MWQEIGRLLTDKTVITVFGAFLVIATFAVFFFAGEDTAAKRLNVSAPAINYLRDHKARIQARQSRKIS